MTSETASQQAKEAKILDLFDGWPGASPTASTVTAYLAAVKELSVEAVSRSVAQFTSGKVERNNAFAPSSAELAENARMWEAAIAQMRVNAGKGEPELVTYPIGELPPPGTVPLGPLEIDYGSGKIDMRGMSAAEKEDVLAQRGQPAGLVLPKMKSMGDA